MRESIVGVIIILFIIIISILGFSQCTHIGVIPSSKFKSPHHYYLVYYKSIYSVDKYTYDNVKLFKYQKLERKDKVWSLDND